MRHHVSWYIGILVVAIASKHLFAVPLTYLESVSGDLPQTGSPLTTFTLEEGFNTFTGTISLDNGGDHDSFAYIIPTGMLLTNAQLTTASSPSTGSSITKSNWGLQKGSANWLGGTAITQLKAPNPGTTAFPSLPYNAGLYNVSGYAIEFGPTPFGTVDYTFSFTVAVPEPTSLSLLAFGSVSLLRRRVM